MYVLCVTWKHHKDTGHWERHRSPTIANGENSINTFLYFFSIDLGAAMLAPSYSRLRECVISSFLLQDIHTFSMFRRPLKAVCCLVFRCIFAYVSQFFRLLLATDAEPLINALVSITTAWYIIPGTLLQKVQKRQLWVRPFEWLKLNCASCVVHQTRSYNMFFVD